MLSLTQEQQMLVESLRNLAENEFADKAGTWQGERPVENLKTLADHGFLGVNLPTEYGGGGMSELAAVLVAEVVGRVCPDTAYAVNGQQMVAPRAIDMFGTEAAKERYLPPAIEGETKISIAISEPQAGSDVGAMNTAVEEDGDDFVLNGEKTWVSGVPHSSAAVVWAKFPEGMGSVIMNFDAAGVEIHQHHTNMAGLTQTQFYMDDVHIPKEYVLTRGEEGFKQQLYALNWERLGSATTSNAIALCAFDAALEYAENREQFGQPIADFQGMEWKFADMAKELQASRALVYQAVEEARESGRPTRFTSSLANLTSSQMVESVTSEALQVHGANGYQQGHLLEYLYRFARSRRIAAGTDEIQKNGIAGSLKKHGLPHLGGD
jgi:alkylation response protein AidB-like acyl-CoA dehydrogenase